MKGLEALKELRQYNSVGLCGDKTLFDPIEKDLKKLEHLEDVIKVEYSNNEEEYINLMEIINDYKMEG